jgi:aromatic-L-amino-acid decarboxylase
MALDPLAPKSDSAPAPAPLGDLPPEVFREYGERIIAWLSEYLADPGRYPVLARTAPGAVRAALPAAPPAVPESLDVILRDFEQIVLPGITHWNHPGFFAYFAITGSAPGILGALLAAGLNVNAMLWKTSPAATELEQVTLGWLRQMLGLPEGFDGVLTDTASISTLTALAAARETAGPAVRAQGLSGLPALRVYASEQAHSSVDKACLVLGLGLAGLRKIPVDAEFRLRPDALAAAIAEDRAAGLQPIAVVATVGTTSTTSIDPLPAIADVCAEHGLWLHVDGAYGGMGAIVPELREVLAGAERADSIVVNPHKWLFTPIECSALFCRRPEMLKQAFSLVPDYLQTPEAGAVTNYMDYGVQLGHPFRALKLWMVIRAFGHQGLAARLREHIRLARQFAGWVDVAPDFVRVAPVPFSTVCFRYTPAGASGERLDQLNEALLNRVNAGGEVYLSHTKLEGRFTLRLAVGNLRTTEAHVARAWELLEREAHGPEIAQLLGG